MDAVSRSGNEKNGWGKKWFEKIDLELLLLFFYRNRQHPRSLDGSVVTIARKELVLGLELASDVLDGLLSDLSKSLGTLEVRGGAGTALVLELVDDGSVLPADFRGETTQNGVSSVGAESEGAEGVGHDEALNLVIRRGDTLEDLQAAESSHTLGSLVGEHTTDDSPEDLSGRTVVEGTVTGVGVRALAQEGQILDLVTVQGSADVDTLTTNGHNLLAGQEFLGNRGRQTAQQMSSAINNHLLLEHLFESLVGGPG